MTSPPEGSQRTNPARWNWKWCFARRRENRAFLTENAWTTGPVGIQASRPKGKPMIISHRHHFIFVHLGRTGGCSLTAALARHCGPEDVITPVDDSCPGQNYRGFRRHNSAQRIRAKVGAAIWNDYFKFTIERNPWDKIVSRYWGFAGSDRKHLYWRIWESIFRQPMSFPMWFRMKVWQWRLLGRPLAHYRQYTQNGRVLVDFIGRYENRGQHLAMLSKRLGFFIDPDIRAGEPTHKVRRPNAELFDPWMLGIVEQAFRNDLQLLGYRFDQPPPPDALLFSDGELLSSTSPLSAPQTQSK
jgi:hypothetical protein